VVYSVLRRKELGEDEDEKFAREAGETLDGKPLEGQPAGAKA
jgi:hypothetical protein